jgi:hypothetical protein
VCSQAAVGRYAPRTMFILELLLLLPCCAAQQLLRQGHLAALVRWVHLSRRPQYQADVPAIAQEAQRGLVSRVLLLTAASP